MLRIGIVGGTGKLGRDIIGLILTNKDVEIGAVISRKNNQYVGCDIGSLVGSSATNVIVTDNLLNSADSCDVYIDCTNAEAFGNNHEAYLAIKKPIIIATTGFGTESKELINKLSTQTPIVVCPNFSIGVYKFIKLVKSAVEILGEDMDIEIIESHHKAKKDKPSGTAKKIAEAISEDNIPIHSIRVGNVVGEHSILFANEDEQIELSHKLFSRKSLAKGAIMAANWIVDKENGLYGIEDICD